MATLNQYQNDNRVNAGAITLVIAEDETTANEPVNCLGTTPVGLLIPSTWITADITFRVLPYSLGIDGDVGNANLYDLTDTDGTLLTISDVVAGIYLPLSPIIFNGLRYLNIVSSVSQTDGALIYVAMTPLYKAV